MRNEHITLLLRFHALCHCLAPKSPDEGEHVLEDHMIVLALPVCPQKALVHLDNPEREVLKVGQVCPPGSEIIQGKRKAVLRQFLHDTSHGVHGVYHCRFRNFQIDFRR